MFMNFEYSVIIVNVVFPQISEGTGGPNPLKRAATHLWTPLELRVSMGGGNRLPSGDPSARLPQTSQKNCWPQENILK